MSFRLDVGLWAAIIVASIVWLGCSDRPYTPSDTEVQQYEQEMKSAIQQEAHQQREPSEQ